MLRTGLLLTIVLGFAPAADAARMCPDGWFEVVETQVFGDVDHGPIVSPDAILMRAGRIGVRSGCGSDVMRRSARPGRRIRFGCGFEGLQERMLARFSRDCDRISGKAIRRDARGTHRRRFRATRIPTPSGAPDLTFGWAGFSSSRNVGRVHAIALTPDDGVLVAGQDLATKEAALGRLDAAGVAVDRFGDAGVARLGLPASEWRRVFVVPDGRVVVFGTSEEQWVAARYDVDGALDARFGVEGVFRMASHPSGTGPLYDVAGHPDGGWILVGGAECDGGSAWPSRCARVVRLDADGRPVLAFGNGGVVLTGPVASETAGSGLAWSAVAVEPDGTITVAGRGVECAADLPLCLVLCQLAADGSPDSRLGDGGIAVRSAAYMLGAPSLITRDADRRLTVMGGLHHVYDPASRNGLSRFLPDGTVDVGFGTGGVLRLPRLVDVVPVTGGGFVAAVPSEGLEPAALLRFTPEWTVDARFGSGGRVVFDVIESLFDVAAHPDGRVSVAADRHGAVYRRLP